MKKSKWLLSIIVVLAIGCTDEKNYVPKPPTYLELNLPNRAYEDYRDTCGFQFSKPTYFDVEQVRPASCNRDITFGKLNGTLHLSAIEMDTSLAAYVNYAIDKVGEHKIKATAIYDTNIVRPNDQVYGTFFELQGNVASPFQFYVTDSVNHFYSGVVYFNARPNYDSIKPTLNFVKKDILELMNTIEWSN